jgi:serine/threonine-protein kinase RsbW
LLLATSPASWKFKGISGEASQRISVALCYRYTMPPVSRKLYAPAHHKDMISKLFNYLGASHDFLVPAGSAQPAATDAVIHTGVNELEGCAEIFIESYGTDTVRQIRKTLREFCLQHIAAINLFLRLDDPLTFGMTEELEKAGFFFAGILPESRIGDALILQYLNNVDLDYNKIILVSDMAVELLVYIRKHDPNIIE